MAPANNPISGTRYTFAMGSGASNARTPAARMRTTWTVVDTDRSRLRSAPHLDPKDPPANAPTAKKPTAITDAVTENPGAPARANPRNTTLPVMLATKTWPSAK